MTTDERCEVAVENAPEWPLFKGVQVAGVKVLSATCRWDLESGRMEATRRALAALFVVIESRVHLDQWELVLIGRSATRASTGRVAAYQAAKLKCWGSLEQLGLELPAGDRTEYEVNGAAGVYAGEISLQIDQLPAALDLTRSNRLLCMGFPRDLDHRPIVESLVMLDDRTELLRSAVSFVPEGFIVLRAHGEFDDPSVSADVFISSDLLGGLDCLNN